MTPTKEESIVIQRNAGTFSALILVLAPDGTVRRLARAARAETEIPLAGAPT